MKGDFTGFTFDGVHSSELGIIRVSDSDRYVEELQSEVRDKTIEIPGNHGEYYYWSTYGPRTHTIDIAFDSMTETQFRQMRQLFGTRKTCELIFDERPYKVYYAKIEEPIELKYICFNEYLKEPYSKKNNITQEENLPDGIRVTDRIIEVDEQTGESTTTIVREKIDPWVIDYSKKQRIYKGEGTITLISYYPFAKQLYRILDFYDGSMLSNTQYDNVDEWADSSGLLDMTTWENKKVDQVRLLNGNPYRYGINVYNPGDLNVGFCLYIPFNAEGKITPDEGKSTIIINCDTNTLILNEITRRGPAEHETGIIINTTNHLIEGVNFAQLAYQYDLRTPSWQTTGTLYNDAIIAGDFPYIKRRDWNAWDEWREWDNDASMTQGVYISCGEIPQGDDKNIVIYYNYLYF